MFTARSRSSRWRVAMLLASLLGGLGVFVAAERPAAANTCAVNTICFFEYSNYTGREWHWWPTLGYRNMPSFLHDHAYSFNSHACAYGWDYRSDGTTERRTINRGDYRRSWGGDFGGRIDAVSPC